MDIVMKIIIVGPIFACIVLIIVGMFIEAWLKMQARSREQLPSNVTSITSKKELA